MHEVKSSKTFYLSFRYNQSVLDISRQNSNWQNSNAYFVCLHDLYIPQNFFPLLFKLECSSLQEKHDCSMCLYTLLYNPVASFGFEGNCWVERGWSWIIKSNSWCIDLIKSNEWPGDVTSVLLLHALAVSFKAFSQFYLRICFGLNQQIFLLNFFRPCSFIPSNKCGINPLQSLCHGD